MKKEKIKLITLVLLVILIIMVGFFGVYSIEKGHIKNGVKDYSYMMDLDGAQVATIELSSSTKQVIKDQEGNIIKDATDEEIEKNNYIKEDEPINKDENKTHENYDLTKQVIKSRLEKMGVSNYLIRIDEETGKIMLELPNDDNLSNILNVITAPGKFEIVDEETEEVLLSKDDISTSNIYRNTTQYGTEISFSIEFNSEGTKKLEEISKTYVPAKTEDSKENSTEPTEASQTQETTENSENVEDENKEKKVTLKMDDTELMSTSFNEPVSTGKMYLTVGQAATTADDVKSNYTQAQRMATLLSTKTMPLTYTQDSNTFIQSSQNGKVTNLILVGSAIVIAIVIVLLVLKYKFKGFLTGICFAGFTAILLLTVRYWNVSLSMEGVVALFVILFLNFIFINKILKSLKKEEDNKKVEAKHTINMSIKDSTLKIIPLFIMAVVFAFANWQSTSSFGMVMFWGLALMELYNLFITKYVLKYSNK